MSWFGRHILGDNEAQEPEEGEAKVPKNLVSPQDFAQYNPGCMGADDTAQKYLGNVDLYDGANYPGKPNASENFAIIQGRPLSDNYVANQAGYSGGAENVAVHQGLKPSENYVANQNFIKHSI